MLDHKLVTISHLRKSPIISNFQFLERDIYGLFMNKIKLYSMVFL